MMFNYSKYDTYNPKNIIDIMHKKRLPSKRMKAIL
jgi:hypothetical protein